MNKLAKLLPLLSLVLTIPTLAVTAQAKPHHQAGLGRIADAGMGRMDSLNLTPAQKTKMEQLRQSARTQIEQVLTVEQRQKFQQIASQNRVGRETGERLDLTADQKAKIKAIRQADRSKFQAILTPAQQAQLQQERGSRVDGGYMGGLDRLNLTADQKAKLEQLKADSRTQIQAVLTPEQRQKAQTNQGQRQEMSKEWQSLNLTSDQKAKIRAIRQASQQEFNAILTPEQQSKLKSGRHGGRNRSL
jgi:Spy/CpxP family protein refolding chaperone